MSTRLFALVGGGKDEVQVRHYRGWPPELAGGKDNRERFPYPHVLVLQEDPHGFFLDRFAKDGSPAGDTWHMNLDDAKYQAEVEYSDALGEWRQVPEDVGDAVAFALAQAAQA